jgi:hypothetical protein
MDIISYIIAIVSLISTAYFYVENRKLKGFEIDRDIKIKKAEFEELNNQYRQDKKGIEKGMILKGLDSSDIVALNEKYNSKFEKIWAEQHYLESLKKYRWIFGKPKGRRKKRK